MKYKIYGVLLICLMIFSLSACSSNHDEQTTEIAVYESALVEKGKYTETDYPKMVMVDGKLYKGTGEESDIDARCGNMDGEITTSVNVADIPSEDGQSNFGTGYGYQYVGESSIDVYMPDGSEELKWMRFVTERSDSPVAIATTVR